MSEALSKVDWNTKDADCTNKKPRPRDILSACNTRKSPSEQILNKQRPKNI